MEQKIAATWNSELPFNIEQVKRTLRAFCVMPGTSSFGLSYYNFHHVTEAKYNETFGQYQIFAINYHLTFNIQQSNNNTSITITVEPATTYGEPDMNLLNGVRDKALKVISYYLENPTVIDEYYSMVERKIANKEQFLVSDMPVAPGLTYPEEIALTADGCLPGIIQFIGIAIMIGFAIYAWTL